tara:strand:+ start:16336 stop:16782 length:447 start_codon:yes stop_codon:yes gene_type:complete
MKPIVQLTEKEYLDLVEKANFNNDDIRSRAKKLYETYGTHAIKLTCTVGENSYDDTIVIKSRAYVKNWDAKYPILDEDAKKIVKFVESRSEELFYNRFDRFIYNFDELAKEKRRYSNRIKRYTSLTITGWLLAIVTIIITLFLNLKNG